MEVRNIDGFNSLIESLEGQERAFLLLYKKGVETNDCAIENLTEAAKKVDSSKKSEVSVSKNINDIDIAKEKEAEAINAEKSLEEAIKEVDQD